MFFLFLLSCLFRNVGGDADGDADADDGDDDDDDVDDDDDDDHDHDGDGDGDDGVLFVCLWRSMCLRVKNNEDLL